MTPERKALVDEITLVIGLVPRTGDPSFVMGERRRAAEAIVARFLDNPEIEDFLRGVALEAQHQRVRWAADDEAGKTDSDWLALIAYLGSKAWINPLQPGEDARAKRLHRIVTVAAAALNWHAHRSGTSTAMRPGFAAPEKPQT